MSLLHQDITDHILKSLYKVYNTLGYGFLENVYERALFLELRKQKLFVQKQFPIDVFYEGENVGKYFADLIVSEKVIVELKAAGGLLPEHEAQLINYLKATEIEVGLLLNFGAVPQFKRLVHFKNKQSL